MPTPSLSAELDALLVAVLDRIIPPQGDAPGAGAVAADHVRRSLVEPAGLLADGLTAIDQAARRQGVAGFPALPPEARDDLLRAIEQTQPRFFDVLVAQTYGAYYSHPDVLRRLGLDPRPPQPRGHRLEPMDLRLVERVAAQPPIYRQA